MDSLTTSETALPICLELCPSKPLAKSAAAEAGHLLHLRLFIGNMTHALPLQSSALGGNGDPAKQSALRAATVQQQAGNSLEIQFAPAVPCPLWSSAELLQDADFF